MWKLTPDTANPPRQVVFTAPEQTLGGRFERLAAKDLGAALEMAESLNEDERSEALAAVMRVWLQISRESALRHLRECPDAAFRTMILERAGRTLAVVDPATALSLAGEFVTGQKRDEYVNSVVHAWAEADPEEAARWTRRLPDADQRGRLQGSIAIEWAQQSPAAAADFVATEISAGGRQEEAALTVALRWASLDPAAAAGWVERFSSGELRTRMLRGVISYWTARDAGAAQGWIAALPAGEFRDAAQASMSH